MDIVNQLLLQLILILLNAFFAATEIAVISLNEKRIKAKAETGDKKAIRMQKMIEDPTRFLSTIQIGITLAGFLGSAFAADNFADRLSGFIVKLFRIPAANEQTVNTVSVIAITLILSYFTLVLGELVPKRIAMQHKEKLAEWVCGIISVLTIALKPIIWFLTVSTNGIIRLFGIDPNEKEDTVSKEDIVLMLDASADEGTIKQDDIQYIKNVFKLEELTAADVMTQRKAMITISADDTEQKILQVIETQQYSRLPVYRHSLDEIVGVLSAKDYLLKHDHEGFELTQAMYDPFFVPETMYLGQLFHEMQKEHTHIAIVVNEYGVTSGIVTLEDVLEEIVGEIWDESDEVSNTFQKADDTSYYVQCSTSVEAFFDYFHLSETRTESATVNGWLTEIKGDIPCTDDKFDFPNLSIRVTKADDLMAQEILVTVLPQIQES